MVRHAIRDDRQAKRAKPRWISVCVQYQPRNLRPDPADRPGQDRPPAYRP
jgi:hypothetical protein